MQVSHFLQMQHSRCALLYARQHKSGRWPNFLNLAGPHNRLPLHVTLIWAACSSYRHTSCLSAIPASPASTAIKLLMSAACRWLQRH